MNPFTDMLVPFILGGILALIILQIFGSTGLK